ncbi:efflux RND transporter periplasmic adaptor subunit [Aidingimonas lacisalsi]|uniref:efflux RND transporter periplasmic adaptor subunit n=1 Tax=Aidingimonas lacisalsi TaxID=2604086 RepID=UPI0011D1B8B8|nr:efflux RND transporter periplasmic adaptor subunit [Aidingimonas lacisalsi]
MYAPISTVSHRIVCLASVLCVATLFAASVDAQERNRTPVIGTQVEMSQWSDPLEALGTLRADESVTISATVTEMVETVNFRSGDEVAAGDLLIQLADGEEQAQLRSAQAQRDERQNALSRATQMQSRNLGSRADVEDNQAQLRQIEAQIDEIDARLMDHKIRAPFSGVIGFRNISPGTLVTPGDELTTLDKLDVVKLDFSVPESFLSTLERGQQIVATTAAYDEQTFSGEVTSIGTRIDPTTRSVMIRAEIDNPDRLLRPGMLMITTLERQVRDALVVPESVLIPRGERQYVLVIDSADDNRIEQREVSIGERRVGQVEITGGVTEDELLVSHGVQRVREGDQVELLGIADDETSIREILQRHRADEDDT